uniref:Putative secreted protein n=1 Tax=Anopheles darlingi TaxID=43151 RepID=A0A2M4D1F7_ANODA
MRDLNRWLHSTMRSGMRLTVLLVFWICSASKSPDRPSSSISASICAPKRCSTSTTRTSSRARWNRAAKRASSAIRRWITWITCRASI